MADPAVPAQLSVALNRDPAVDQLKMLLIGAIIITHCARFRRR